MRKLKLDVEQLEVESFDLSPGGLAVDGTVRALRYEPEDPDYYNESEFGCGGGGGATGPSNPVCIGPTYCCNPTANTTCCPPPTGPATCPYSCPGTCPNTCPQSCYPANCIT